MGNGCANNQLTMRESTIIYFIIEKVSGRWKMNFPITIVYKIERVTSTSYGEILGKGRMVVAESISRRITRRYSSIEIREGRGGGKPAEG